jgi:hypothetical protein
VEFIVGGAFVERPETTWVVGRGVPKPPNYGARVRQTLPKADVRRAITSVSDDAGSGDPAYNQTPTADDSLQTLPNLLGFSLDFRRHPFFLNTSRAIIPIDIWQSGTGSKGQAVDSVFR